MKIELFFSCRSTPRATVFITLSEIFYSTLSPLSADTFVFDLFFFIIMNY